MVRYAARHSSPGAIIGWEQGVVDMPVVPPNVRKFPAQVSLSSLCITSLSCNRLGMHDEWLGTTVLLDPEGEMNQTRFCVRKMAPGGRRP